MKTINLKYIVMMAFGASMMLPLSSCEEALEALPLEYKEDPKFSVPTLQESWKLEEMNNATDNGYVYAYKDKLYDEMFTRTHGWNGGDGVQTTLLPGGNLFWTFNDSFYGVVEAETRARKSCSFPRNTIMVQTANGEGRPGDSADNLMWLADFVQTDNPNAERYYHARTHLRHPNAAMSDADIQRGEIDQDYVYWAGDGTVVDGKLQQLWNGVYTGDGNMTGLGTALAIYNLDGKPGDENYLKIESVNHNFFEANPYSIGQTMWEDEDGHTYLYGSYQQSFVSYPIVARSKTHDLNSGIEYYVIDNNGEYVWSDTYPTADFIYTITNTSLSMPWVFKKGDYYYMTGQAYPFGKQMYILRSKTPYGPFEDCQNLFVLPSELDKIGVQTYRFVYMVHLHMGLSREGELVFSTNTDIDDFWGNFNAEGSADFYRPFFYRVYKWENLFEE